jgi:EAL domain-containing protein (putative c-di-GMP-specific phosphodiesterase class I)
MVPATEPARAGRDPTWQLLGRVEAGRGMHPVAVTGERFVVGRHPDGDLVLNSSRVSGRHAALMQVRGHLFIRDLDSTNGTFVNRERLVGTTRLREGDHVQFANLEFRVEMQEAPPSDYEIPVECRTFKCLEELSDDWVFSRFDELMRQRAIEPHFQRIVRLDTGETIGFEALARSPLPGLQYPNELFGAAAIVQQEVELSLICRERAIEVGRDFCFGSDLYVNTHPQESLLDDVVRQVAELRRMAPDTRLVIEVHEATIQSAPLMLDAAQRLRDLGVKLAYDDFGAGQSRLLEICQIPPDVLKFDRQLISGIDRASPQQHRLLKMLVEIAAGFGSQTLAEGIETLDEAAACRDLGFHLAQGYFFGRPAPAPIAHIAL